MEQYELKLRPESVFDDMQSLRIEAASDADAIDQAKALCLGPMKDGQVRIATLTVPDRSPFPGGKQRTVAALSFDAKAGAVRAL